eukprot:g8520.t1
MKLNTSTLLIVTLLGCLTSLHVHCMDDWKKKVSTPTVVSVPRGSSYLSVVTLDGGGLRGIVSAMVLIGFENSIKSYILHNRPEAISSFPDIKHIDDFEVNIADYVDCFSGVSSGGWAALYLASKGIDSPIAETFNEHVMIAHYGTLSPGSAKALMVLYLEFGDTIFPHKMSLPGNGLPKDDDPLGRGVMKPIYYTKGIDKALYRFFGDMTMANLSTTCVIPSFDLLSRTMTLFIHNHFFGRSTAEVAELQYRVRAQATDEKTYKSHVNLREDVNFYVRDIARASGATPVFLPAKDLIPIGGKSIEYIAVDGTMGGNSPILETLAYVANACSLSSLENVAVLSIGNGMAYEDYEDNANGGFAQWTSSGEMLSLYTSFIGDMVNSQLDLLFYSNPQAKPEQFLRIQRFEPSRSVDGYLLSLQDKSVYLKELQSIGEGLATNYKESLDTFVQNFVFTEETSSSV